MDNKEVTKVEAERWLDLFNPQGESDPEGILEILNKRTVDGEPVIARVITSPMEIKPTIISVLHEYEKPGYKWESEREKESWEKKRLEELQPQLCIWDLWDLAFTRCAYLQSNPEEQTVEFLNQDLYPAFAKGLLAIVNLHSLIIGVCKPKECSWDESGLHCENGPAVSPEWSGKPVYFWHNTEIPAEWIENKDNLDPMLALEHENQEMRRILCEIIGWDKIVERIGGKEIQQDRYGVLIETPSLNDGEEKPKFVKVKDGSHDKYYFLRVHPTCKTAHEGVAATYGKTPKEYHPNVRT